MRVGHPDLHRPDRRSRDRARPWLPTGVEPTFFQRYECKYVVPSFVVPEMRGFLRPFARLDGFAARRPDGRYPICSLYLDSPDLLTYRQTVGGDKNRFKLRVRTYSDDPESPAFLEVKRKINNVVNKRRAGLDRRRVTELLRNDRRDVLEQIDGRLLEDVQYFVHHVERTLARPVIRIRYLREAYEATGNEPVRVTIDSELTHAVTLGLDLRHDCDGWVSTPVDGAIIEIKFTERFPWWVEEFIRRFGMHQRPVPKYVMSLDHVLLERRPSVLALAGMTLPPRRG